MRQRGGSRKRDTRIRTPREGEVGPEGRHNAAPCQATAVASPMRVRLFNLPILLLPLLAALLSPIFVCSFVLVAPPINSLSPRPSFRCEEGSRTGGGGVGSGLGPAARVAPAAAAVARRCRICRPSGTRTHALQDEILEGIAAVVDPGTEASAKVSCVLLVNSAQGQVKKARPPSLGYFLRRDLPASLFLSPPPPPSPGGEASSPSRATGAAALRPRRSRFPRRLRLRGLQGAR